MSDDVARAIGAGGKTVTIAGKECKIRPLSLVELTELERDCLERYQDRYLATFYRNQKLLKSGENGESDGSELLMQKIEEVAKWDITDLPPKYVYDSDKLSINPKLQSWLKNHVGFSRKGPKGVKLTEEELDAHLRSLTANVLDQGILTDEEYKEMVKKPAEKRKMGYVGWWTTSCFEGRISTLYVCLKDSGLSREELVRYLQKEPEILMDAVLEIERLSAPAAGNG